MHARSSILGLALLLAPASALGAPPSPWPTALDDVPADIRAILERGGPKTPEETQRLQAWGLERVKQRHPGAAGATPGDPAVANRDKGAGAAGSVVPVLNPKVSLSTAVPTREGYVALLDTVVAETRTRLDASVARQVDALVARRKADLEAIGATLTLTNAVPLLAAHVLARAAREAPDDGTAANNLGVALRNLGEIEAAWAVLARAAALRAKSPLVAVNQGYVALDAGDGPSAERCFGRALLGAPDDPMALAGQGLLRLAQGRREDGERYLRAASRHGYAGSAELAIEPDASPAGDAAPSESAQVERGRTGAVWPVRTGFDAIPAQAEAFVEQAALWTQRLERAQRAVQDGDARLQATRADVALIATMPIEPRGGVIIMNRRYPAARALLQALNEATDEALAPTMKALADMVGQIGEAMQGGLAFQTRLRDAYQACRGAPRCMNEVSRTMCAQGREDAAVIHGKLAGAYNQSLARVSSALADRVRASAPFLREVTDPVINRYENLVLREGVKKRLMHLHLVPQWLSAVGSYLSTCPLAGEPPEPEPGGPAVGAGEEAESPCPTLALAIGPVALELGCRKAKVELSEGVVLGVELEWPKTPQLREWGTMPGSPTTKMYGGVGHSTHVGPLAEAGAKAVVSVTVEGGEVSDVGFEVSAEAGVKNVYSAEQGVEWSLRQHLESGPDGSGWTFKGVEQTFKAGPIGVKVP